MLIGEGKVEEIIAVTETVLDYSFIDVPTGDPAPTPAEGYQVKLVLQDVAGKDIYIQYKTFEREHTCPT